MVVVAVVVMIMVIIVVVVDAVVIVIMREFPLKDMDLDLNKRKFRDTIGQRCDWAINDNQSMCVCGARFSTDYAMICKRVRFIIQNHNELRDLEAELLNTVCYDVEVGPVLQPVTGGDLMHTWIYMLEVSGRGKGLHILILTSRIRVYHPNADSYKDLSPKQLYRQPRPREKRKYATRVVAAEQGTFTPLVLTPPVEWTKLGMHQIPFQTSRAPCHNGRERRTAPLFYGFGPRFLLHY